MRTTEEKPVIKSAIASKTNRASKAVPPLRKMDHESSRPLPGGSVEPKNRFMVEADCDRFIRWCQAALASGMTVREWVEDTLDEAAAASKASRETTTSKPAPKLVLGDSNANMTATRATVPSHQSALNEILAAIDSAKRNPIYGLKSDREIFIADRASRLTNAESFAEYAREVLMTYSEALLAAHGMAVSEIPKRFALPASVEVRHN